MKKIIAVIVLLALLIACKPEQPVQPVVQAPVTEPVVQPISEPVKQPVADPVSKPAEQTAPSGQAQTVKVDIAGFKYVPASVKIKVGDTVTWTQVDTVSHTVTIVSGPESFDSGLLRVGQTFSHTFRKPGTYSYKCTPHPNMRGEVIVE